jgi:hypothetical protein
MKPLDRRTQTFIDEALGRIASTGSAAAVLVLDLLDGVAATANRNVERNSLVAARTELRLHMQAFNGSFIDALRDKVKHELNPQQQAPRSQLDSAWESLSLVDEAEVEERLFFDRIGQAILHECEWESRDLNAYMGSLLGLDRVDRDTNPLRPEVVGAALCIAIEAVTPTSDMRKLLAREFGPAMAKAMRKCYAQIVADLQKLGLQPVQLGVRPQEGAGGEYRPASYPGAPSRHDAAQPSAQGSYYGANDTWGRHSQGGGYVSGHDAGYGGAQDGLNDAELMTLIRRLNVLTSGPGAFMGGEYPAVPPAYPSYWSEPSDTVRGHFTRGSRDYAPEEAFAPSGGREMGPPGDGRPGLMAVNLIRAHRDELRQASTGQLDHMVIEVVGSLFDQILSDARVPPQMARQIARLQLPVLRVALRDATFFSSRKHPVRRFVNRIASLACAFDEFDAGPGKEFLARVSELVQEIIEGDFDQVDVYSAKLTLLEDFIQQQNAADVSAVAPVAALLDGKESELRVQQNYVLQLQSALAQLPMDDFLRDFLAQVWSQALVAAARRDGPQAQSTQRLQAAATDLVLSVQSKSTPALRKEFLRRLPVLMKTLRKGLALIDWPQTAQQQFFGKLLPLHAESLKGQGQSELDRNLLTRQLEAVFQAPIPDVGAAAPAQASATPEAELPAPRFTAEEVAQIGLVDESTFDWDGKVDIDLDGAATGDKAADDAAPEAGPDPVGDGSADLDLGVDIGLGVAVAEPAEPSHGAALMNHLRVGFAYQMHLNDKWRKVRLSYISGGRGFFVFTHGRRHQETLSLTARMLSRLCETDRMRAFESSYLLERATARARRQLAALTSAALKPAPGAH